MSGPSWRFDYAPMESYPLAADALDCDFVVATHQDVDPARLVEAVARVALKVAATPLLSVHPLFWTRLELSEPVLARDLVARLSEVGIRLRYVTSAVRGSKHLGEEADFDRARPRKPRAWPVRGASQQPPPDPVREWFKGPDGIMVDPRICGTGVGTRLALIDNDGREIDKIALDAEIEVGVHGVPRASAHAALMLGWAVGANKVGPTQEAFSGVAPDASARFYCIPKPREQIFDLPVALVRAVDDGADVVVCATYVDGQTSPLLDDALEFARRLGRGGRGSAVVMPASREMSSAPSTVASSLSLGFAEPASDPRVFCIGPSARDGGWFLWRDRRGQLRPFANRGPALRWLAPGDDMPSPLAPHRRATHAESSGAAAVAAGALLLLLGKNPTLTLDEVDELLTDTAVRVDPARDSLRHDLANPRDVLPTGVDDDGHNAKHGYGRLNVTLACAAASDPMVASFIAVGEAAPAIELQRAIAAGVLRVPYSPAFGAFAARAVMRDPTLRHAAAAVARALRLWWALPGRAEHDVPGSLLRQTAIALRLLGSSRLHPMPEALREELEALSSALRKAFDEAPGLLEARLREALKAGLGLHFLAGAAQHADRRQSGLCGPVCPANELPGVVEMRERSA